MKTLLLLISVGFLFSSCGKSRCGPPVFFLATISFSANESDSIILKRFNKGDNFSTQLDSLILSRTNTNFQTRHDTVLPFYFDPTVSGILFGENDYIIILPKANRTFKLTDIRSGEIHSSSGEKSICYNGLISYNIDGQVVNVKPDVNSIFIRK